MSSTVAVAELMATFRMGLLAIIPVAERSHIAWNGPRVYDPWEDIERVFFQSFVTCVPENAVVGPFRPMATYGLHYRSYADFSFLTDQPSRLREQNLVFWSWSPRSNHSIRLGSSLSTTHRFKLIKAWTSLSAT